MRNFKILCALLIGSAAALFLDCDEVGVDTICGINGPRPIAGHTNDVHNLMVYCNIFARMGRSAIEFTNARNDADGNLYPAPQGNFGFGQPYLRVKTPEPAEWHNLKSWREEHGWDKHGAEGQITAVLDPQTYRHREQNHARGLQ